MPSPDRTRLDEREIHERLAALPAWTVRDGRLVRELRFAGFRAAIAFLRAAAEEAEALDHHPDWSNSYDRVRVELTTHSAGGLTALDFALAARMDALVAGAPPLGSRVHLDGGAPWEPVVGYSRAVRIGERIHVTGTTATLPGGGHVGDGDAYAQALQALRNVQRALAALGSGLEDVVRTRIYVTDIRRDWEAVGRAHSELLGAVRPATTMVEVRRLIAEWMLVEIEADAVAGAPPVTLRRVEGSPDDAPGRAPG